MPTVRVQSGTIRPRVVSVSLNVGKRFSPCLSQGRFHAPASSDAVRATSGALSESGTPPRSVAPWQVRAMASLSNRRNQQPGSRQGEVTGAREPGQNRRRAWGQRQTGRWAALLLDGIRPVRAEVPASKRVPPFAKVSVREQRRELASGIRPTATDRRFDDLLCIFEPFFGSFSDCR